MTYTKTVWKDQDVENPRTYILRDNGDDTTTLLDAFGTVTEIGTPVNAQNMNHIENGIADLDNAVVHKTGDETITGVKTFTSEVNFSAGNSLTKVIQQDDENFCIYKNDIPILATGTDANTPILVAPANKTTQQYAIVTTQYISNLCVKFSNGLMIQWGNSESGGTINFHQPFVDNNVVVTATIKSANGTNDNDAITSVNSVGFYFHNYSGGGCFWTAFGHWY